VTQTPLPTAPASSTTTLSETGSTLLEPLFKLWAPGYQDTFHQVTVTVAGGGSGKGISSAAAGTADIGASDAYLSPADVSQTPTLQNIPLAVSAQMVDYNLPNVSAHIRLNGTVLAQMYEGTITRWNDPAIATLNPGVSLPSTPVVPVHRSDSSGDTFLFTSYLSKQDSGWSNAVSYNTSVAWPKVPSAVAASGNSGMVTACQAHPGCVAYIGISYESSATAADLGEAQLANGIGQYELPSTATIGAADASFSSIPGNGAISLINSAASGSYPIINYEYAIVNSKQSSAVKAKDIQALLEWAITTGSSSSYLRQVNFQPLPAVAKSVSQSLIPTIHG
jgi:phosphate transport system substrate-binding protein